MLDAFHVVNQKELPVRFFEKDFKRGSKRIILTDQVFQIAESVEASNILCETESRWNLVETAWRLGISSNLLDVSFDENGGGMVVETSANRRRNVTSARGALNGYQKGRCFYCYAGINAADNYMPQVETSQPIVFETFSLTGFTLPRFADSHLH